MRAALLAAVLGLAWLLAPAAGAAGLVTYRDRIEQAYNARDEQAIEAVIAALRKAGMDSGQEDMAVYYTAFARLRQSALPGMPRERARAYLDQCITELGPVVARHGDDAPARALYASCLGASTNYYLLRATTRGMASSREISKALELAPDHPWVVFQDAVIDSHTPAMFGGNKERALGKLRRAEELFVASRPAGSSAPVFGESETWLYIGRVLLALDREDEAREALEKSLDLAPDSADARDELAKL